MPTFWLPSMYIARVPAVDNPIAFVPASYIPQSVSFINSAGAAAEPAVPTLIWPETSNL